MAVKTVSYGNSKSYVGATSQPLGDVLLVGPAANVSIKGILVDTGADYLQVPAGAATTAGWSLSAGTLVSVGTAGGTTTMTLLPGVSVEIEGTSVIVDLLCHPSGSSKPLLGRSALRALKEVGFDLSDWLWA
jgi:predicted aspartyl protease